MYGIALGAGLDADLLLMTGSESQNIVEADLIAGWPAICEPPASSRLPI
jgi:hypothetical protein